MMQDPIRIGISSCLLGEEVRFDGGHKRDSFLVDTFGKWVEWVMVCPEVEVGMGTPRETLRLVRDKGELRMVTTKTGTDHTDAMNVWARRRVEALEHEDLCGYVLKKDSPSCGMERVKVYDAHASPTRAGVGLFAAALLARFPLLPVEEEGRLSDPRLRENFVERVFAYRRVRSFFSGRWPSTRSGPPARGADRPPSGSGQSERAVGWTVGGLVRFHTAHKLLLMAHSPEAYRRLGRLVAGAKAASRRAVHERYEREFMEALKVLATARRHVNVLQHMMGYFRDRLDDASRRELVECVEEYRRGLVPLIVPLTLVRHHVRALDVEYLAGQVYLEPNPKELMLRNHV